MLIGEKGMGKQLEVIQKEETADDWYFVFHYNCWQYDYYEEPLQSNKMLVKRR